MKEYLDKPLNTTNAKKILIKALKINKETKFFDFKEDFSDRVSITNNKERVIKDLTDKIPKYASAFSNTEGGFLIYGIQESDSGFRIRGINFHKIKRKTLLFLLKKHQSIFYKATGYWYSFIEFTVDNKTIIIFKFKKKYGLKYKGSLLSRIKDRVLKLIP